MTEKKYYQIMGSFTSDMSFKEIHKTWYKCFNYILLSFKVDFSSNSIKSLFYDFDMENWEAMWQENTKYKSYTKEQLINEFCEECSYISDRVSYDRLFRTHWFFRKAFNDELNRFRYPMLYKKESKTNRVANNLPITKK